MAFAGAVPAAAEGVPPSGQPLSLHEVLAEPQPGSEELFVVLRFLAPDLAATEMDAVQADLDWACETFAPEALAELDAPPAELVVELMERSVPRGQGGAEVAQVFAGYHLEEGACVPSLF